MKKTLYIFLILHSWVATTIAQQWVGSTNINGSVSRKGSVFLGNLSNRQYLRIESSQWPELRFKTPTSNEKIRLGVAHADHAAYGVNEGDFYVFTGNSGKMPLIIRKEGTVKLNGNVQIPHYKTFGAGAGTAVKMWGIRGQAGVNNQRLELSDRVSIGYPSGWNNFPEPPKHGLYVYGNSEMGNLSQRHYFKVTSKEWPEVRFETPTSNEQIRLGVAHADHDNYGVNEGDFYVYTQTTNKMPFVVRRNGDLIFNMKGGSVGIGTSTAGNHKLSVNGSIRSKEVKVEANWSDFVFYDNYKLRTLEEVEQHIAEKGHLPEIPNELEVKQNGINLGDMNARLLQKIEELTLYLIEQNKELKSQKDQNQAQQKLIEQLQRDISSIKKDLGS